MRQCLALRSVDSVKTGLPIVLVPEGPREAEKPDETGHVSRHFVQTVQPVVYETKNGNWGSVSGFLMGKQGGHLQF